MVRKEAKARRSSSKVKVKRVSRPVKAQPQVCNVDLLQRALRWIVGEGIFDHLPKHGNTSWLPTQLIVLAILWVWSDHSRLTAGYQEARQAALRFYSDLTLCSYQGFIRALVTWTERLRPLLWS